MRKIIRTIKDNRGVSIAEMLVTVVIMSMVMLVVASVSMVAQKVMINAQTKADAHTLESTTITLISSEITTARSIEAVTTDDGENLIFYSESRGRYVEIYNGADKEGIQIRLSKTREALSGASADADSDAASSSNIVTDRALVTAETSTSGLYTYISGIQTGEGGDKRCVDFTMTVYSADGTTIESDDVTVHSTVTAQ